MSTPSNLEAFSPSVRKPKPQSKGDRTARRSNAQRLRVAQREAWGIAKFAVALRVLGFEVDECVGLGGLVLARSDLFRREALARHPD